MKDIIKRKIIYTMPAVIVMIIMLTIFMIKGMYPFGNGVSLEIDADYNYVPTLFKIYDIFHSGDSILWDFKLGGGANIYGSLIMNSIFSPLNWLVILVKRENIVYFYNILLIIKFMCMATTMFIFIRKNFKQVENFWQIILSIIYVFSGWGLLMYSNIFYIDIVILFPIIIHYLIKFFKENKSLGLIITLCYSAILNIYLSYMIYLFVIFSSLLAIFIFVDKPKRKEMIVRLSFSLVFPLIISSFSSLPTVNQILTSIRGENINKTEYFYYFFLKVVNLTMSALIILLFAKYLKTDKKNENKKKLFYIILFLMTTIGVIIEPINKIWHTGSYNALPYRYSFISIFTVICGSLEYLSINKISDKEIKTKNKDILLILLTCAIAIIIFVKKFNTTIIREVIAYDITKPGIFITLLIIFALLCIMYKKILIIENNKLKKILISLVVLFEIGIYSNWCFNDYHCMQSIMALQYKKETNASEDNIYKYIDYQATLGVNSSYITREATLSNWLHIIPQKQIEFVKKFGYAYENTLIYGYGGTILTDLIIGTKNIYSKLELPNEIFNLKKIFELDEKKEYFYEMKYNTSFGFKYNNKVELKEFDSILERHNYYYKQLFGIDKDIINIKKITIENDNTEYTLKNNEPIILYLEPTEKILNSNIKRITIDDEKISIGSSEKIVYIDKYNKSVRIKIERENEVDPIELRIGYIRLSDYKEITKLITNNYNIFQYNKNKLHINIDSEDEQYLFLPINNIDGWSAKNNGKKITIEDELYTFMSIKLEKGNNDIELEFKPPMLEKGILISIFSTLLLTIYKVLEKKISKNKIIQKIIVPLFYIISISLVIYVYIISNFIYK